MSQNLVIVNGARTAFGAYGGSLAAQSATDLAVVATKGALQRAKVQPDDVDFVIMGNVLQTSKDAIYLARHVALRSGCKESTPGLILNLLCGSGVMAVANAEMLINSGQAKVVVAGGTDSLSMTPYISWGVRWGARMGHTELWDGLDIRDTLPNNSMGETAENLQAEYNITRQEQDEFAILSQKRFADAQSKGIFNDEIVPVTITDRKGKETSVDKDEHCKPDSTVEGLAKLRAAFKKDGTVTAGNACGIVDGASALVVMQEEEASKRGLKPLSRVVSWAVTGVPPRIMGIGPVPAIPLALEKAKLKLEDIELIEINEAFAAQYLACEKVLKLDREKVNVNGGAIAVGHPFGATGARLILTLSNELHRRKARYGCVSLCIGGGMGIAMIVERV